ACLRYRHGDDRDAGVEGAYPLEERERIESLHLWLEHQQVGEPATQRRGGLDAVRGGDHVIAVAVFEPSEMLRHVSDQGQVAEDEHALALHGSKETASGTPVRKSFQVSEQTHLWMIGARLGALGLAGSCRS